MEGLLRTGTGGAEGTGGAGGVGGAGGTGNAGVLEVLELKLAMVMFE
ncbi:hypothetical protein NYE33_23775 [Paenibacillus sp. FSL R10-2199]